MSALEICKRNLPNGEIQPEPKRVRVTFHHGYATYVKVPGAGDPIDHAKQYAKGVWPEHWLGATYEVVS